MANTIIFVILLNLASNSDWVYIPLYNVIEQELACQVQILDPASAGFFFHEPSTSNKHIMIQKYTSFGSTQKWAKGAEYLQLSDIKLLLEDVSSISPCCQGPHVGQVAAVAAHGLDDEHAALGAAGRLLDAVTRLLRDTTAWVCTKNPQFLHFSMSCNLLSPTANKNIKNKAFIKKKSLNNSKMA